MPPYVLLITAFVTLIASAATYFFGKKGPFICTLILFYACNTLLSSFLFYNHQTVLFSIIVTVFVAFPVICLIVFAVDTYFAVFCTDTSFVFVLVWLLIPMLFIINLISYLLKPIHV